MKYSINFRRIDRDPETVDYIEKRLSFVLARSRHLIESIMVTLSDINGPKGGIDRQCLIIIKADGLAQVVITEKQDTIRQAIDRSIARAAQNLERQIKRRQQLLQQRVGAKRLSV